MVFLFMQVNNKKYYFVVFKYDIRNVYSKEKDKTPYTLSASNAGDKRFIFIQ